MDFRASKVVKALKARMVLRDFRVLKGPTDFRVFKVH
jgi:hypothetical protein